MIRAVIFDFNGVLVDDEHVHFELLREVLAQEQIALSEREYHQRYLGYDDRGCFEVALREAGRDSFPALVDELIARKAARYADVAEAGLRFFPGAGESLQALAERWPLAVCSGALRPEIEYALKRLGRRDRVGPIISAEDTTRCKPDPEGYLLALEALRLQPGLVDLEARQCLVVEDSLAGVESAKRAGMIAVGVGHTYRLEELRDAGADALLPALDQLSTEWIADRFSSSG